MVVSKYVPYVYSTIQTPVVDMTWEKENDKDTILS